MTEQQAPTLREALILVNAWANRGGGTASSVEPFPYNAVGAALAVEPDKERLRDNEDARRYRWLMAQKNIDTASPSPASLQDQLAEVGRAMVEMTTCVRGPDEWAAIPALWQACMEERDALRALATSGEPPLKATLFHDAGAYARCYCGHYSMDPRTLGNRQPACQGCGQKHGWSGSFVPPGADAKWSGDKPIAPETATPSLPLQEPVAPVDRFPAFAAAVDAYGDASELPRDHAQAMRTHALLWQEFLKFAAPSLPAVLTDARLWSFLRSVMSHAASIEAEHTGHGYEVRSAHLDAAASEYVEKFRALATSATPVLP